MPTALLAPEPTDLLVATDATAAGLRLRFGATPEEQPQSPPITPTNSRESSDWALPHSAPAELPVELWATVCGFLGLRELGRLAAVARSFAAPVFADPSWRTCKGLSVVEEAAVQSALAAATPQRSGTVSSKPRRSGGCPLPPLLPPPLPLLLILPANRYGRLPTEIRQLLPMCRRRWCHQNTG